MFYRIVPESLLKMLYHMFGLVGFGFDELDLLVLLARTNEVYSDLYWYMSSFRGGKIQGLQFMMLS